MVYAAGQQVQKNGKISSDLHKKLEEPMILSPVFNRRFLEKVNHMADQIANSTGNLVVKTKGRQVDSDCC